MSINEETVKAVDYNRLIMESDIDSEPISGRIKIYSFPENISFSEVLASFTAYAAEKRCTNKILFYVTKNKTDIFKGYKCRKEGMIKGFFNGKKDAYIYSFFLKPPGNLKSSLLKQRKVMDIVKNSKKENITKLSKGYVIRRAQEKDAPAMAELYKKIFASYPTPMDDYQYIAYMMNNAEIYYIVAEYKNEIVSASSADVLKRFECAEMTDCATLPEHRGKGLMLNQFDLLLKLMKDKNIKTVFSYSRALSVGMNIVNARYNFEYGGCLLRQSNIAGNMENMNIWYKVLNQPS